MENEGITETTPIRPNTQPHLHVSNNLRWYPPGTVVLPARQRRRLWRSNNVGISIVPVGQPTETTVSTFPKESTWCKGHAGQEPMEADHPLQMQF